MENWGLFPSRRIILLGWLSKTIYDFRSHIKQNPINDLLVKEFSLRHKAYLEKKKKKEGRRKKGGQERRKGKKREGREREEGKKKRRKKGKKEVGRKEGSGGGGKEGRQAMTFFGLFFSLT